MRILKLIIGSIVVMFLILTLVSFFIPSKVRISKAIDIRDQQSLLLPQIADESNWKNWFFVNEKAEQHFNIVESGKTRIVAEPVAKGKKLYNTWSLLSYPGSDTVTVHWYMDFYMKWYPWEKFSSLLLEKTYGSRMAESLEKLKILVEN